MANPYCSCKLTERLLRQRRRRTQRHRSACRVRELCRPSERAVYACSHHMAYSSCIPPWSIPTAAVCCSHHAPLAAWPLLLLLPPSQLQSPWRIPTAVVRAGGIRCSHHPPLAAPACHPGARRSESEKRRIRETPTGFPPPPTRPALSCNADSPRPPPARYMLLLEDLAPAVSGDQARAITAYSCDPYGESLLQL